jgi:hypothetical protein
VATIETYQTKSGKTLWEVRHHTPSGRTTRSRGSETKCYAKEFASSVEVFKMRGENVGKLWARDTAQN